MFKRYIKILSILLLSLLVITAVCYISINQKYHKYSEILNRCNEFEDKILIKNTEWSSQEKIWWNDTCNHGNKYSDAIVAYNIYRDSSENEEPLLKTIGGLILVFIVSFIGRWVYQGKTTKK